jgi:type IV pilus assembly protein PilC
MPKFKYEIQQEDGVRKTGTVTAETLLEASQWVRGPGETILSVGPAPTAADWIEKIRNIKFEPAPGLKDVLYFTKQLSVMIRAGISIREALSIIAEQCPTDRFRNILTSMKQDVESGLQFSEALSKYPKVFSPLYMNMVRASEMSGSFAHMLERIGDYLEEQAETRAMVKSALMYPIVLMSICVAAVIFLLTFVLPAFEGVFKGKEHLLPTATKALIWLSNFLQYQWYIPLSVAIMLAGFFIYLRKTPQGRLVLDRMNLKMPLMKKLFRAICISTSLKTMGELINAGVPLPETLSITSDISGNSVYQDMWGRVKESVMGGSKIVTVLNETTLLPSSVVQMIAAGEEGGRLGQVLEDVSRFYAKELRDTIKTVTGMLEPIMIVFMGGVVGFIAMSILLPIFKMGQAVTG